MFCRVYRVEIYKMSQISSFERNVVMLFFAINDERLKVELDSSKIELDSSRQMVSYHSICLSMLSRKPVNKAREALVFF